MTKQPEGDPRDAAGAADGADVIASRGQSGMDFAVVAAEPLVPVDGSPPADFAAPDPQPPAQSDAAVNEAPVDYDG
jgi:hypothetical protein